MNMVELAATIFVVYMAIAAWPITLIILGLIVGGYILWFLFLLVATNAASVVGLILTIFVIYKVSKWLK